MAVYYTILTEIGKAKLANATALGQTLQLTQIAVGDGNGSAVTPVESMTALVNQVWVGNISDLRIDANQSNWIIAESYIASDVGGFTVREVGLFDDAGDLIAVGNYPDSYKPVFTSGAAKDMLLRIIIEVSNADVVELKIDPAIILATREYVDTNAMKAWNFVSITSDYTANVNDFIKADTSASVITVTLPATPLENEVIGFLDKKGTFDTNPLSIARNGNLLMGKAEDMTVNTKNISFELIYINGDWRLK